MVRVAYILLEDGPVSFRGYKTVEADHAFIVHLEKEIVIYPWHTIRRVDLVAEDE